MTDREKIINAIEKAKKQSEEYDQDCIIVPFKEADMILDLLKKQEPKQVISLVDSIEEMTVGYCPSCGEGIANKMSKPTKFCRYCGQAVK